MRKADKNVFRELTLERMRLVRVCYNESSLAVNISFPEGSTFKFNLFSSFIFNRVIRVPAH